MASNKQQALDIQARMATLRQHMDVSVDQAAVSARRWSDWRYYVRRFPLATIGLAAGVGYLIVPRRYRVVVPDAKTLAKLAEHEQLVISRRRKSTDSKSIARTVLGVVAAGAARAAASYIGDQFVNRRPGNRGQDGPERGQPSVGSAPADWSQTPRYPR